MRIALSKVERYIEDIMKEKLNFINRTLNKLHCFIVDHTATACLCLSVALIFETHVDADVKNAFCYSC